MNKLFFVFITLVWIDSLVLRPILEWITQSKVEFLNLLWFADIFFLLPISHIVHRIYDKYITDDK